MPMTTAPSKETILLITDNESSRVALGKSFTEVGYEVLTVANEHVALELLQQTSPSLVVADTQACSVDKLRLHKALKATPIVALRNDTPCSEDECLDDLRRGADLAICNQTTRALVARVRAVLRRMQLPARAAGPSSAGGVQMDLDRHEVRVNGKLVDLTPKEFQILRHFLESPSRVFSRQEMLNCVWGEGYALEEHALDVHIHSLRQKIEDDPAKPKLIITVRGIGYKLRAES
jgi:two-component system, OmpR family, response regulator RegX3